MIMKPLAALLLCTITATAQAAHIDEVLAEHSWPTLKLVVPEKQDACFNLGLHADQSTGECWIANIQFDRAVMMRYADLRLVKDACDDSIYSRLIVRFEDNKIKTYLTFLVQPRETPVYRAFPNQQTLEKLIKKAIELKIATNE
jgi:hypothetical protein